VFHTDVAKIDRDVAHVAIVVHIYCKRPFQMFHLLFQMYLASVLIWMLHMFHTHIVIVCSKYFISFRCMLQVFHGASVSCFRGCSESHVGTTRVAGEGRGEPGAGG
jgi:hypothetical protein